MVRLFEAAQIDDSVKTPLSEQLDGLSVLITKLSYVFAGLIIVGRLMVFFHWSPIVLDLNHSYNRIFLACYHEV